MNTYNTIAPKHLVPLKYHIHYDKHDHLKHCTQSHRDEIMAESLWASTCMCMYIYTYTYTYICSYIYIYIYIYIYKE
jgi:hypothetical protein